jgi:hypothetical protein
MAYLFIKCWSCYTILFVHNINVFTENIEKNGKFYNIHFKTLNVM